MAILSKQIGWSQEANLIYELIKQTNRLNQIVPGNQPPYGVKRMSQMIGWSTESKLYYEWLKQLDKLTQHYGCPDCTPPSTACPARVTVDIPEEYIPLFDLGDSAFAFGCWIKITDSVGPSTIFSFGEYPSTWQALTIENGNLIFWYDGTSQISVDITPYIGQWTWLCLISYAGDEKKLYINGIEVGAQILFSAPIVGSLYIGSGNAPNTCFNGLMRDFVFCIFESGLEIPPTEPRNNLTPASVLLLFQGTDLTQQLTDNGLVAEFTVTNSGAVYNADSPYVGYEGSTQFGTPPAPTPPPGYVQALTFRVDNTTGDAGQTTPGIISGFPPFTMYVDWGDGSALQPYAPDVDQFLSHTFTSNSIFDVKVYLQDPLVIYSVVLGNDLGNFHLLEVDISAMTAIADVELYGNKLPSTQVNAVLAQLVANGGYSGIVYIPNQTPPAPPTGQGIIDKATLISRSWSVTTD